MFILRIVQQAPKPVQTQAPTQTQAPQTPTQTQGDNGSKQTPEAKAEVLKGQMDKMRASSDDAGQPGKAKPDGKDKKDDKDGIEEILKKILEAFKGGKSKEGEQAPQGGGGPQQGGGPKGNNKPKGDEDEDEIKKLIAKLLEALASKDPEKAKDAKSGASGKGDSKIDGLISALDKMAEGNQATGNKSGKEGQAPGGPDQNTPGQNNQRELFASNSNGGVAQSPAGGDVAQRPTATQTV